MKKTFVGIFFITILLLFLPTTIFAYENVPIKNSQLSLEVSVEVTGSGRTFDIVTCISNNGNETVTIMIPNIPGGGFVIYDGEWSVYYAPHFFFPDVWYLTLDPGQSQEMYSETWKGVDDSGNKLPSGDYSVIGFVDAEGRRIYSEPVGIHLEEANSPLPPVMWTEDFSTFYISVPQDPEGDQTYYMIDWGDGTSSGWVGPYNPGEVVSISHVWGEEGVYQIKVKAKDQDGESKWAVYSLTLSSVFKFFHPTVGYVRITYVFTIYYEDSIYYLFDWGDGTNSGWLGPCNPAIAYKSWNSPGEYTLRWKAKDMYGAETPWSDPYLITILPIENQVPTPPIINGPTRGRVGIKYDYTFNSTDQGCDELIYMIEWGDGTHSVIMGLSGNETTTNHTWSKKGTYVIKAKSKNAWGWESGWGTLGVSMPRTISFNSLLMKFLERFPHAFPILRKILAA